MKRRDDMNEIKCPNCGKVFTIDEASYASIQKQVRDSEFSRELKERLEEAVLLAKAEKDKQITALEQRLKSAAAERDLAVREAVDAQQRTINDKEQEVSALRAKIDDMEKLAAADRDAAVNEIRMKANKKFSELQEQINRADADKALAVQAVTAEKEQAQHQHELQIMELNSRMAAMENDFKLKQQQAAEQNALILKSKDEEIAFYKDFKSRQSTKMLGETLEQHCEIAFNQIRPSAFPGAYFEKDNDASLGTKGDYIFTTLEMNSSGLCLNIAKRSADSPERIAATVFLVSTVPAATFPIRSYLIWLASACCKVCVLVFAGSKDVPPVTSSCTIVPF
ncbi:MAG: DUF2130 domain-containing protein [Lachnospiraceae bacterium]|nr:DUF2130 domain-containing protein [Lachnospiraceae bacterium]